MYLDIESDIYGFRPAQMGGLSYLPGVAPLPAFLGGRSQQLERHIGCTVQLFCVKVVFLLLEMAPLL
jgi:hypothetical protein